MLVEEVWQNGWVGVKDKRGINIDFNTFPKRVYVKYLSTKTFT